MMVRVGVTAPIDSMKPGESATRKGHIGLLSLDFRFRAATQLFAAPLQNVVEADPPFVSGKEKNKHAGKQTPGSQGSAYEAVVFGMIERYDELRTAHVPNGEAKILQRQVRVKLVVHAFAILSDEFVGLGQDFIHLQSTSRRMAVLV